jgi:methyl-accepting chemotaxis protein
MITPRISVRTRILLASTIGQAFLVTVSLSGLCSIDGGYASTAGTVLIALTLAGMLTGTLCCVWLLRSIVGPLHGALAVTERFAAGDLTEPITERAKGEFGELLENLGKIGERIFGIVGQIRTGTMAVASTSGMLVGDNTALSSRTESQAAALQQTSSTIEQLMSTVKQNADNALQTNKLTASASACAIKGGKVVNDMVSTMGAIKTSSTKVVDIIAVIDGIAFQTNILALNAAVEAARAGEHGRGFAVVASEVRGLAQRSATAAKEIKGLIAESVENVEAGSALVNMAGLAMNEIVTSVKHVADIMSEISAASQEQSDAIEEVNRAVVQIDSTTQKNAALVGDASKAIAHLQEQSVSLTQVVSIFNLGAREFGNADEAAGMVKRAVAYLDQHDESSLIDDVNTLGRGQFIDRDLYLSIYSIGAQCLGHGTNPRLVGVDGIGFKDPDGKLFVKEIRDTARSRGAGWVDYRWAHPVTKELQQKSTYFERAGNLIIACGCYNH